VRRLLTGSFVLAVVLSAGLIFAGLGAGARSAVALKPALRSFTVPRSLGQVTPLTHVPRVLVPHVVVPPEQLHGVACPVASVGSVCGAKPCREYVTPQRVVRVPGPTCDVKYRAYAEPVSASTGTG
jgi:hypothetical protein